VPVEEWLPTNVRAAGTERVLAPGQALFHLGDSTAGIYEVLQGQVRWSIPRRDREKALPHARGCAWLWWTEGVTQWKLQARPLHLGSDWHSQVVEAA
jgi:hypothetical protein